jgi:hypothetical protein
MAHCHLGLGTLYTATSQREQARTALATAIALYRTMDMIFWLPQAEAALAQVNGRPEYDTNIGRSMTSMGSLIFHKTDVVLVS